MKPIPKMSALVCVAAVCILLSAVCGQADDTCMFYETSGKVPPNIVLLLDNGAEMQQTVYHPDYDSRVDFAPEPGGLALNGHDDDFDGQIDEADEDDLVKTKGAGSGFFNARGYGIVDHGGAYYLVIVRDDLELAGYASGIEAITSDTTARTATWTFNGRSVTLPTAASAAVDEDGIKDNAGSFRYAKNYLNWIFFSGAYTGNGSDLPRTSRFYNAKKALLTVGKLTSNQAKFGIYNFTNVEGASSVQPLQMVVETIASLPENNVLDVEFINNVNNMGTVTYSPLAEGLATIGGVYNSPSTHVVGYYCQKNFVIVITPGVSSMDRNGANQYLPKTFSDYDGDGSDYSGYSGDPADAKIRADSTVFDIPLNLYGTSWLDDVAHYLYTHDMVGYQDGFQNVRTFTVGFMGDLQSNLFLINTSNNGNGNPNLYDTSHKDYGKYHFVAESPDDLTATLLAAVNAIISQTMTYTAPVVPVTRTISSDKIYMSLFKPLEGNFWEGNVVKFGLNDQLEIIDAQGNPATWSNGALKKDAQPLWATKNWADPTATNFILNSNRNIYTYLGESPDLAHASNRFDTVNSERLTADVLGNPALDPEDLIRFIRGADVFDEDSDDNTDENRENITGDVLHSEPLIIHYNYPDNSMTSMVFFGSNDGMLHAVLDMVDPDIDTSDDETDYGTEAWAFIPPDQLHRLKNIVEGLGHQFYVDSSPKAYIKDVNGNGILETTVDSDGDGDVDNDDKDQVIIVCGERKGGSSHFALDVTNPAQPKFMWRIAADALRNPTVVIPELGQSWSEAQFGQVKISDDDTTGIPVFFIGAGFSADNSVGQAVLAINVMTGEVVKKFANGSAVMSEMNYSIPSTVKLVDENDNGFVDKVYVGDLGGQMWRIGQFADPYGNPLDFFETDENIHHWTAEVLFRAPTYVEDSITHARKFYYPPSVTLERGYDLVFMGTGDREDPCNRDTAVDRIYCVKDVHTSTTFEEADLVDLTDASDAPPDLDETGDVDENGHTDQGWYIRLEDPVWGAAGEKVLAKGTVFYKTYYITTFTPNNDPCVPGGAAKIYALDHKSGAAVLSFGGSTLTRNLTIGGGIPSNPVPIITSYGQRLFISIGSTIPADDSQSVEAGVISVTPLAPDNNFHYLWWREL